METQPHMQASFQTAASSPAAARKREAALAADFALHVGLIVRVDGVPKSKAIVTAWVEGPLGLQRRLLPSLRPVVSPGDSDAAFTADSAAAAAPSPTKGK